MRASDEERQSLLEHAREACLGQTTGGGTASVSAVSEARSGAAGGKGFGCARASGVRAAARLIVALLAAQCPFGGIHHVHDHADDQLVEGRVAALARLDEALDPLLILLDPCLGSVGLDVVESGIEGLVRVRIRVRIRVRVRS